VALIDQFTPAPTVRNRLLGALLPEDLATLWPSLEPVDLTLRQTLQTPEAPMEAVYFIETGWISMIATLEDGDGAEVGLVGHEGMLGLPLLLNDDRDDLEGMVQCQGTALRLPAAAFQEALVQIPSLRPLLNRYALVHHGQVARTGACNGRHHIDQRLARWLLMAHDRAQGDDTYPMTHEFLSMMLAVRRAGISTAAMVLQRAGLIRYSAGRITITDRDGLENASCECYGVTRRASERLFGLDGGRVLYRR
jgi:CRP-like cAMP-binding protein